MELAEIKPVNPLAGASWTDSHVHFDVFDRGGLMDQIIARAQGAGVNRMIAIGGSEEANARAVRLAQQYPGVIQAVVGFDRDEAKQKPDVSGLTAWIQSNSREVVGIGECGLDYHYEPDTAREQKKLFAAMLEVAASVDRPVVVHSREADDDTLDLLRDYVRQRAGDPARPGVLHCFTGTYAFAKKLLDLGMMISFSGILTFRNADELRACAAKLPMDRLLIETDAPYLAPVPHRGKTNEPAWVVKVAETLASLHAVALQHVADQITDNSRKLFVA